MRRKEENELHSEVQPTVTGDIDDHRINDEIHNNTDWAEEKLIIRAGSSGQNLCWIFAEMTICLTWRQHLSLEHPMDSLSAASGDCHASAYMYAGGISDVAPLGWGRNYSGQ